MPKKTLSNHPPSAAPAMFCCASGVSGGALSPETDTLVRKRRFAVDGSPEGGVTIMVVAYFLANGGAGRLARKSLNPYLAFHVPFVRWTRKCP